MSRDKHTGPFHLCLGYDAGGEQTKVGRESVTGIEPEREKVSYGREERALRSYLKSIGELRFLVKRSALITSEAGKENPKWVWRSRAAMARQSSLPRLGVTPSPVNFMVLKGKWLGVFKYPKKGSYPNALSRATWAFSEATSWATVLRSIAELKGSLSQGFYWTNLNYQYRGTYSSQSQALGFRLVLERHEGETTTFEAKEEERKEEEEDTERETEEEGGRPKEEEEERGETNLADRIQNLVFHLNIKF